MATTPEFTEYVCEQISGIDSIRSKKMFGEYMVYINDKPILLVCDNTVFVKKLDIIQELLSGADTGFPYVGAKEHYILDIDNAELSRQIVALLESVTAFPKPKRKKTAT